MTKFDSIIILGYCLTKKGKPNPILKSRLDLGIKSHRKGLSTKIIVSGGITKSELGISEAEGMRRYLEENGIESDAIIKEEASGDTLTNLYIMKKEVLRPKKWNKLLIVTSDFHKKRVELITKKILGPNYKISFKTSSGFTLKQFLFNLFGHENDMYNLTEKLLKDIEPGNDTQIKEILKYNPFYSKDPKIMKMSYKEVKNLMKKFGISNKFMVKYGWYIKRRLKKFQG